MNKTQAIEIIKSGRIFTCEFRKKDGTIRKLNGRSGVSKYTNGVGAKYSFAAYNLLPVYDLVKKSYRVINESTIISLNGEPVTNDPNKVKQKLVKMNFQD